MQTYPEPTVGALILNAEDEVLLVRSHKWRDCYVMPGGHIELGETMEAALIREIREETGLGIHDIEFIGFQEFIRDAAFWKERHFIFFDYACRADSTDVTLNSESEAYRWVSLPDTLTLPVEPYTRHAIQAYLAEHPRPEGL